MKNILMILCDQMRGDCLGAAGHPDVKTPYLDKLANDGVRFENAYSPCPSCIAARAALMTGMKPKNNGRVGYADGVRWDYVHTLAGELTAAGYQTQCVGKMHVHPLRNSLGYQNIELHDGYLHFYRDVNRPYYENQRVADDYSWWLKNELGAEADITDCGIECNSYLARPWIYDEKYHPTNWVTDRSLDFLRRRDRDKPFFLTASYVRPHPPFDAPQVFFDFYKDKKLREPFIGDWEAPVQNGISLYDSPNGTRDSDMIRMAQIGYYACISHLDNQIGRLLDGLIANGLMSETMIVFVSDHGEMLFDHNMFRKSRAYEGSANVPLIFSGAGVNKRGVDCSVVSLFDVMPTILSYAGVKNPETADGVNLLNGTTGREYIHGEHSGGEIGNQFIVTEHDKYIWFMESGEEQYFDLDNDPHELHDASKDEDNVERITYLRNCLIRELDGREEGYSDGRKLIPGRPQKSVLNIHKS